MLFLNKKGGISIPIMCYIQDQTVGNRVNIGVPGGSGLGSNPRIVPGLSDVIASVVCSAVAITKLNTEPTSVTANATEAIATNFFTFVFI